MVVPKLNIPMMLTINLLSTDGYIGNNNGVLECYGHKGVVA